MTSLLWLGDCFVTLLLAMTLSGIGYSHRSWAQLLRQPYSYPPVIASRRLSNLPVTCTFPLLNVFLASVSLARPHILGVLALWLPETTFQHLDQKGDPAHFRVYLILCLQEAVSLILVKNEVDLLALGD